MFTGKAKRVIKLALTFVATGLMCDLCGGTATTCIYDGIKNGEPVTVGQVITIDALPINAHPLVQWGS
jgi:hypothetical protein